MKRIVTLGLALTLILALLAGCGGKNADTSPSADNTVETNNESAESVSDTAENAAEPDTAEEKAPAALARSYPENFIRNYDCTRRPDTNPVFGNEAIVSQEILSVTFLDSLDTVGEGAWDVSEAQDGSVMAWVIGEPGAYDLYIAGNGGVTAKSCHFMFAEYTHLTEVDLNHCFYTTPCADFTYMFLDCGDITRLDLSELDTSSATEMICMFWYCEALTSLDVSGFDTSKVERFDGMFQSCESLTEVDVSGFDTSSATNFHGMFYNCRALTSIDVSGFDTSNAIYLWEMFENCASLESIDVSSFDTSKVEDFAGMFAGCKALTKLDLSNFSTVSAERVSNMFKDDGSLAELDISGFDVSGVEDAYNMFRGCAALTSYVGHLEFSPDADIDDILLDSGLTTIL